MNLPKADVAHAGQIVEPVVQDLYTQAIVVLVDNNACGVPCDYTAFQDTLNRINLNGGAPTGSRVLVCPVPPPPNYGP